MGTDKRMKRTVVFLRLIRAHPCEIRGSDSSILIRKKIALSKPYPVPRPHARGETSPVYSNLPLAFGVTRIRMPSRLANMLDYGLAEYTMQLACSVMK